MSRRYSSFMPRLLYQYLMGETRDCRINLHDKAEESLYSRGQ